MKKKIFLLIPIFILVGVIVYGFRQIRVADVTCTTQNGMCPSEIQSMVDASKGKSYFDAKNELASTLAESMRIARYTIRFNLPSTLAVEITERKPEIAAKFGENTYFLFDKDGVSLGEVSSTELPIITVFSVPRGERVNFAVRLARDLVKYYSAGELKMDKYGLYAKVKNGVEVVFPLEGDLDVLLGSLEVTLSQLNRGREDSTIGLTAGKIHKVDLRYKNPVISQI
ncbi:hypothetical protein A2803_00185 [Candidatus Woesebacteria bacterium RIFCSPHIGHO2_01_FULL_44_21]|uniref:Uncharacterized protein n=1 Tax=Candidatus Woesebacteria bacterium RIFCSPHIGHO2_01_FULL_44_21 TaxID=1802503 RepID=A0A1F7Z1E3_9BACT|nr:MAG: hypothetical protein A2803_00185 [Candidatus Woesebacteria bacterium RIFCSPHIGHO2_01_FULL_44_21]OGM71166.1 MAG: hypothetical protein A2897_03040 [Candidatus Woesebacteria bacterium RIFCSPLOWO2_01_FULL_44_24b]